MLPTLGPEVEECQQNVAVLSQAFSSLLVFDTVSFYEEPLRRPSSVSATQISAPHPWLLVSAFRQFIQYFGHLMDPTLPTNCGGPNVLERQNPKAARNRDFGPMIKEPTRQDCALADAIGDRVRLNRTMISVISKIF